MTRRVSAIAALLLSGASASSQQVPGDLGELMRQLAERRHGEVSFVEQHFLKLLKRPAESYGELTYDAPDRLEKRTVEPKPETLTLAGDVLTVVRGGRARTLDLKSYPALVPFIESIRATLAGDLPTLERLFTVEFAGTVARWRLTLTPRDPQVAKTVSQVRIDGANSTLTTVEILETDGDRSLMTLREHPMSARRAAVLGAWLCTLAAAAAVALHARYITDLSAFLPAHPTAQQRILVEQLREGPASRLILIGIEGGSRLARAAVSLDMARRLRARPRVLERQQRRGGLGGSRSRIPVRAPLSFERRGRLRSAFPSQASRRRCATPSRILPRPRG